MTHDLRPFRPDDADWLVARHAALYARDEGFDGTFAVAVRRVVGGFLRGHDPACETGWIAWLGGQRQGSIFCTREAPGVARLRLFLVEPEARGTGLAQHMLDGCLGFARGAGYGRICLTTHECHRAAVRLYVRNGFALAHSRPVRNYGRDLVEQAWERAL